MNAVHLKDMAQDTNTTWAQANDNRNLHLHL
jgi:hypothetical protein